MAQPGKACPTQGGTRSGQARPSQTQRTPAGPSQAKPALQSAIKPNQAQAQRPARAQLGQSGPSRAQPGSAKPSQGKPGQAQAKPSQARRFSCLGVAHCLAGLGGALQVRTVCLLGRRSLLPDRTCSAWVQLAPAGPSQAKPGPAKPGQARPSRAQPSPARPRPSQQPGHVLGLGVVGRPGSAGLGLTRAGLGLCLAGLGWAWLLAKLDRARPGWAWLRLAAAWVGADRA